jgi:UTP:GlnB (protein PII) uridylyltransferase
MTVGEKAEDVFYISDEAGKPIGEAARAALKDALLRRLDENLIV